MEYLTVDDVCINEVYLTSCFFLSLLVPVTHTFHHRYTWFTARVPAATRASCSSGIEENPVVFYRIIRGSTAQTNKHDTFYLQQRPDNGETWADIKVNHPLDYESIKEYNLTVRVEVSLTAAKPYSLQWFVYPMKYSVLYFPQKSFSCENGNL